MVSSSSVAISSYPPPPLPPPPPPPPSVYRAIAARPLAEQILEVKSLVCKRRPQRMEARLHFRGVHRELLDRVENGQWRRNSTGASKWSCHAPHEKPNSRVTPEVKQALLSIAKLEPPRDHQGIHICEITQIQDVFDLILKEIECHRHVLKHNEAPKLALLALRYGVSVDSIRKCNGIEDRSSIIPPGRAFLYIPPLCEESRPYALTCIRRSELISTVWRVRRRRTLHAPSYAPPYAPINF